MKRSVVAVTAVAAAAVLAMSACSSSKNNNSPTTAAAPPATSAPAPATSAPATSGTLSTNGNSYKFTFIEGILGDPFYVTMSCGIKAEAANIGNISVDVQGGKTWDVTVQTPIINAVTAAKPDAIMVAPNDVKASRTPIAAAMSAGIKVVLVDTTLTDASGAVSQIASDNLAGGKAAFEAIKEAVPGGGKVIAINTVAGVSTTDQRQKGFEDAAKADSAFTLLPTQFDKDDASIAAQVTSAALAANPDIVGIFATNLFSASGAAAAIKQANLTGKVFVVGFDAGPDQVKALQDGTVQALIAQEPYNIGVQAVDQAVLSLTGGTTNPQIGTGSTIITKDNLSSPESQQALYKASC